MTRPTFARAFTGAGRWLLTGLAVLALAWAPTDLAGQTGQLVGTVRDASSGRPLEAAQVYIDATGIGALTNANGRYLLLNVPVGEVTLVAELVGYRGTRQTTTVTAGESTVVDFAMAQTAIALDEIVVTGAGIATEKRKLGNTIATIDAESLQDAPITSFSDMISGREPGMVGLPNSGTTGEGASIRIRGSASLSQSNEPIVYIDGIRVDNGGGFAGFQEMAGGQGNASRLDDIDPNSIERIEVLKGAAAATLYGTEASNGVIQIFTKRGRAGTPSFTVQVDQSALKTPTNRMIPLADFARTAEDQQRIQQRWGLNVGLYEPFQVETLPTMFETGHSQTYSASVNGGGDLITYFVSGRYADEDGPYGLEDLGPARDQNTRVQASSNINIFPRDDLRIRFSALYSEMDHTTPDNSNNIYGAFSSALMSQLRLATPSNLYGQPAFASLRENLHQINQSNVNHFSGSLNSNLEIAEGIIFDATFGVDVVNDRSFSFRPFGWNVDNYSTSTPDGTRTIRDRNGRELTGDFKLSWDTRFGDDVTSTFLGGAQGFLSQDEQSGGTGTNFPGPGLEDADAGADQTVFEFWERVVNAGVYVQEQVGWRDYLFVTGGARWDANSAFGEDFNTAFYPKASVSFIPETAFGWDNETLSTFRLRAAIGRSGLQPGAFDKFTTYSSQASEEGAGIEPENLGNDALKPEVATEWELGSELGFMNDRFGIDVTYWNRTVEDALVARQFPVTGGFSNTQLDNIGEMKAWGVEVAANGSIVNTESFSLNLFANTSRISEEITDMGGAPPLKTGGSYPRYRNFLKEGFAPGSFFGAEVDHSLTYPFDLTGSCAEPSEAAVREFFSLPRNPGDFEVLEVNCTRPAPNLDTFLGKPTPDWQGSFGTNISFLGSFELSSLFEYKFGNFHVQDLSGAFRQANSVIGRNTPEAARVGAIMQNPASTVDQRIEAAQVWARQLRALSPMSGMNQVRPADWLRWREASLTYRLPGDMVEGMGLSTASLSVNARNLHLWVNSEYTGMDPEVNILGRCVGSGLDCNFLQSTEGWGMPIPRRFTVSARVTF